MSSSRMRWGAGLVGFLLIGFAASLPELSSITASVRKNRHEMAIGEVLGTNFVNISLIFLADAVYRADPSSTNSADSKQFPRCWARR